MLTARTLLVFFLVSIFVVPITPLVSQAHAQNFASLSISPSNVSDLSDVPGSSVSFSVEITDSPSIDGFLVTISYDPHVLNPLGVDYSNGVLGSNTVIPAECVGLTLVAGDCQVGNTVELALSTLGPGSTPSPTNGLLMTINFNVTGVGLSPLHFLNAALANAEVPVLVSTSDGYFTNAYCPSQGGTFCTPPIADFTIMSSPMFAGSPAAFNASSSSATNTGATIQTYSWDWGDPYASPITALTETSNPITSHSFVQPGNYTVTLTVTDTFGSSASKTFTVTVILPPKFTIGFEPPFGGGFSTVIVAGRSEAGEVELNSLAGFVGDVNLTVEVYPIASSPTLTAALTTTSLELRDGGANSTTLLVSVGKDSVSGEDTVQVTGQSGTQFHSISIVVFVERPRFLVSCYPILLEDCDTFAISSGTSLSFPVFVTSINGFAGTVRLGANPDQNITVSFARSYINVGANETVYVEARAFVSKLALPGLYPGNVLFGTSPNTTTSNAIFGVLVSTPAPPNISLKAPSTIYVVAGQNTTFQVSIRSLNGFAGLVYIFSASVHNSILNYPVEVSTSSGFGFWNISSDQVITIKVHISVSKNVTAGSYIIGTIASNYIAPNSATCGRLGCLSDHVALTIVRVLPSLNESSPGRHMKIHNRTFSKSTASADNELFQAPNNSNGSNDLFPAIVLDYRTTTFESMLSGSATTPVPKARTSVIELPL